MGNDWYIHAPEVVLPEKYDGGVGGPKVELNPKPKRIPILGQFGALKIYIHIKNMVP